MAFKERPFIDCKAESERNDFKYVNLSMSPKESFSWIAIGNWSQNLCQLMMSPSSLDSSNFGNLTLTSWIWMVLEVLPWLEIPNELNDGLSLLTLKCPLALFPTLPVVKCEVFSDQSP